ncbi:DUF3737 family protein [Ruminococcus sp. Marseille-P6503]|uniref:DUF3737 family protein n=1 Tax=Ruminococcus sp. Marseille-P6503 TaxID=2364796 RepID=UPI000F52BC18|nr:DUF3737 family protein [Ruminococcus sp. Marseille-P6503]
MKQYINDKTFDEERALYNLSDAEVENCIFAGPADGESALKESRNVAVRNCKFSLRYPLWHSHNFILEDSQLDVDTRAPIWYARGGKLVRCTIEGVKCLRECDGIEVDSCVVNSPEFGWKCRGISIDNSEIESEYFLFESSGVNINKLKMKGKYSFQYIKNMHVTNSELDTKDAFWHSSNVTVENSVIKSEYLGWYSDGLTLINCKIIGTQPFCYCTRLKLINCTMEQTDLSFEYSDVEADISGNILSVKNPRSGSITADSFGAVITEKSVIETDCKIIKRNRGNKSIPPAGAKEI